MTPPVSRWSDYLPEVPEEERVANSPTALLEWTYVVKVR